MIIINTIKNMENKINIVKILKSCPLGMELDCTIWNNVTFGGIDSSSPSYPIEIKIKGDKTTVEYLTKFGEWNTNENSKCVIFPKGKTTWEGFVPPHKYKNGDVVITALGNTAIIGGPAGNTEYYAHCVWVCGKLITDDIIDAIRFATESEKAELFKAIKENGYKWNEETKTLEKLIEPKFKVGNKIKEINSNEDVVLITDITDDYYIVETEYCMKVAISMNMQNNYELVPNKFDISTLVPFESKVLVRDYTNHAWLPALWGIYKDNDDSSYPYKLVGTMSRYCIPYEGNEHLLGTSNDCSEFYKTWK